MQLPSIDQVSSQQITVNVPLRQYIENTSGSVEV